MRKVLRWLVMLLLCLCMTSGAMAEIVFLPQIADWNLTLPLEVTLTADVTTHMPFDDDRCAQLNALLKHLSLRLNTSPEENGMWSRVGVRVDEKEALYLIQHEGEDSASLQFSFQPDTVYTAQSDGLNGLLGAFTDISIYGLDGGEQAWLEDGYAMLNAIDASLESYKKEAAIKTAIKSMGTARKKITYTVPKADASVMAQAIAQHCPEGELRQLLTSLTYSGQQKLILWLSADGDMLRAEYAGNCGVDGDHLRKVSIVWRMRRDDTAIRDDLTVKTPAVKGTDYNTLNYDREIVEGKKNKVTYESEFTYSWKADGKKTTLSGEVDLTNTPSGEKAELTGTITVKQLLPGEDTSTSVKIKPELTLGSDEGTPVVSGKVTVQELRGKNVLEEAAIGVEASAGSYLDHAFAGAAIDLASMTDEQHTALSEAMSSALLPHLVLLPQEDTLYLSADLPEDVWQRIVEAAQQALPEEVTP